MPTSVESSSPMASLHKGSFMGSSPLVSPSSDKRFWSNLRNRIDTLLENQKPGAADDPSLPAPLNRGEVGSRAKRLKEDSMLLLRGFDSVASSLSQLSNNLENALQGARDLARPPTLSDIVLSTMENAKSQQELSIQLEEKDEDEERDNRGLKRKLDSPEYEDRKEHSQEENNEGKSAKETGKLNRAKNIAISMAKKAASLAREMKSIKSDLCFMQERCCLLEEENRRLRDGFAKGMRPEEDDLVRLQMEALLAEKSRLANENANLTRENQCLHQLVEYHQHTSQELSETYEHVMRGMCLDFSSPPPPAAISEDEENGVERAAADDNNEVPITPPPPPQRQLYGVFNSLGECSDEEQKNK